METKEKRHRAKDGIKTCPTCTQVKPTSEFYRSAGGFRGPCKECERRKVRLSQQVKAQQRRASDEPRRQPSVNACPAGRKRCYTCKEVKELIFFQSDKDSQDMKAATCTACKRIKRNKVEDIDKDRVQRWIDRSIMLSDTSRKRQGDRKELPWEE